MTDWLLDMGDGSDVTLENVWAVKAAALASPGSVVVRVRIAGTLLETELHVSPGPAFHAALRAAAPPSWAWPPPAPVRPPPSARRPPVAVR